MFIAKLVARWWRSFLACLIAEEALEGVSEFLYLKLRQEYIERAKRGNTAVMELTVETPSSVRSETGYDSELKAMIACFRSSDVAAWLKEQRKLRVLLFVAADSNFASVQLAVTRRIRRVLEDHFGLFPAYPNISFVLVYSGEESGYVIAPSLDRAGTSTSHWLHL